MSSKKSFLFNSDTHVLILFASNLRRLKPFALYSFYLFRSVAIFPLFQHRKQATSSLVVVEACEAAAAAAAAAVCTLKATAAVLPATMHDWHKAARPG